MDLDVEAARPEVLSEGLHRRDRVVESNRECRWPLQDLGHVLAPGSFGGHRGECVLNDFHFRSSRAQRATKLGDLGDGEPTIISTDGNRGPLHAVLDLCQHCFFPWSRHSHLRYERGTVLTGPVRKSPETKNPCASAGIQTSLAGTLTAHSIAAGPKSLPRQAPFGITPTISMTARIGTCGLWLLSCRTRRYQDSGFGEISRSR